MNLPNHLNKASEWNENPSIGLVVPIDVEAFCVGIQDSQGENPPTASFAGGTVSYLSLTSSTKEFMGDNINISLDAPATSPLKTGIHLHWALPDALTKASHNQGKLTFPPAPNRWLVTRILLSNQKNQPISQTKSWVVESDTLIDPASVTGNPLIATLPVINIPHEEDGYRFLGSHQNLNNWKPTNASSQTSIKDLTGNQLCAVSTGVASFAAYYPDSASVFGFHDPLDQPDDPQLADKAPPVQLMYVVQGWYTTPSDDPIQAGLTVANIQKEYGWTWAKTDKAPTFSTYYGLIQHIGWNPHNVYVAPLSDLKAKVTLGNNAHEALAAFLHSEQKTALPFFEKVIQVFQRETHCDFSNPKLDQLAQLSEEELVNEFSSIHSGTIYAIVKRENGDAKEKNREEVTLLPSLADNLNQLNNLQQQYDFYCAHAQWIRSQLFSEWYHIFKFQGNIPVQNTATTVVESRLQEFQQLQPFLIQSKKQLNQAYTALQNQIQGTTLQLKPQSAPRYWQPNEPVVAIASDELAFPSRYGSDGAHTPEGYLVCRLLTDCLTGISVHNTCIASSQFPSSLLLPANPALPHPTSFNTLLQEACLLNVSIAALLSNISDPSSLFSDLQKFLQGEPQSSYQSLNGIPPSLVMMGWWNDKNPWLPLFMQWSTEFLPTCRATVNSDGSVNSYLPNFFTANYTINPQSSTYIEYTGNLDLNKEPFDNEYTGHTTLSPSSQKTLASQLNKALKSHADSTLTDLVQTISNTSVMVQALSGFNQALVMRRQQLQLPIQPLPSGDPLQSITQRVSSVIEKFQDPSSGLTLQAVNKFSPDLVGYFNPIRAGFLQLKLTIVDVFGQKRAVDMSSFNPSSSMTCTIQKTLFPNIAYLPPRLAQPARLLFRWIAANNNTISEMNPHPANTPIFGWLLPSHIGAGSLFLYNAQGKSLGIFYPTNQGVQWQSAPGDNTTVDLGIKDALQYEHPELQAFANALAKYPWQNFQDLLNAIDLTSDAINAQGISSKSNMATLVGKPIALVQTYLRLEIQGSPAINQHANCYQPGGNYAETDNGFTQVNFPVILGDPNRANDGLVGYFKENSNNNNASYDFTQLYQEGSSLNLTATPHFNDQDPEPPALEEGRQKLCMLIDPRAKIHAISGILPTVTLEIPPDQFQNALNQLEFSFFVAPLLKGNDHFYLPTPLENGFQFSWIQKVLIQNEPKWQLHADILSSSPKGIFAYTPQHIIEGWACLNPIVLEFHLLNTNSKPTITVNTTCALFLNITNKTTKTISFSKGTLTSEDQRIEKNPIFYIHLEKIVDADKVAQIQWNASGWSFQCFHSSFYGAYWGAVWTGKNSLLITPKQTISIQATNVTIASITQIQPSIYFSYYNLEETSDGTFQEQLNILSATQ